MRIAIAQFSCRVGDPNANCATMATIATRARDAGCDLIVFPELSDTGTDMQVIIDRASTWDSGPCESMRGVAANLNLAIACGLSERDGDRVFNTLAVIDSAGTLIAKYRKVHLFSADPVFEHEHLSAGSALTLVQVGGFTLGLMLCYDIRFPEMARALALRGADVLIVPAAWPFPRLEHWKTLTASRAIENQAYLVAANRVGTDGPLTFCGTSRILDPWGTPLATASEIDETLVIADINHECIAQTRTKMQVFKDRRPKLYAEPT